MKFALVLVLVLAVGCSKSNTNMKSEPSAAVSAAAPVVSAAPSASAAPSKSTSYAGTYSLAPAALYIPDTKDYKGTKQAKDDPSKHVGDGALSLEVDGAGRVTGSIDTGPASPAVIDGALVGEEIRGTVRRKTPSDDGLTGTFAATVAGGGAEGKVSLAESNAAIVREGKLSLKKK